MMNIFEKCFQTLRLKTSKFPRTDQTWIKMFSFLYYLFKNVPKIIFHYNNHTFFLRELNKNSQLNRLVQTRKLKCSKIARLCLFILRLSLWPISLSLFFLFHLFRNKKQRKTKKFNIQICKQTLKNAILYFVYIFWIKKLCNLPSLSRLAWMRKTAALSGYQRRRRTAVWTHLKNICKFLKIVIPVLGKGWSQLTSVVDLRADVYQRRQTCREASVARSKTSVNYPVKGNK